jgi:hypothetical protein
MNVRPRRRGVVDRARGHVVDAAAIVTRNALGKVILKLTPNVHFKR